ncbi:MAG TPA: site-specific integrase, partial [Pirellulales bacterium]
DNYRLHLLASGLAVMTARIRLQFARAVFRSATRHRLIGSNPFEDVTIKSSMPDKSYFVTPAEIATVIEAAPDHHWRLIIALARWGGLRTPSETLSLRWQDIDWERSRINVQSPKTERFANKGSRVIPLFPELLPYLRDSFDAAEDGAVYVVNPRYRKGLQRDRGWRDCNLRNMMLLILKRAGVKPWGRLFHNLRSSRQTELANKHPAHVVCSWLGNTEAVARQHYLQVTSEHFEAATKSAESVVHPVVQSVSVLPCRDSSGVANSAEIA